MVGVTQKAAEANSSPNGGAAVSFPAWHVLERLTNDLSAASTVVQIGHALLTAGRQCGLTELVVVEPQPDAGPPNVIFDSRMRDSARADCSSIPDDVLARMRADDPPSRPMRVRTGQGERASGAAAKHGLVVPVYDERRLMRCALFWGGDDDIPDWVCSLLVAAVHAAHCRLSGVSSAAPAPGPRLTMREHECLHWISIGKTDAEAGRILGISARTVRFHIDNIKAKLGVVTRLQVVANRWSARSRVEGAQE